MSLRLERIGLAIQRFGSQVTVDGTAETAVLRPIAIGQLQTYMASGAFASWERPVYVGLFLPSASIALEDDFVGPDFEGTVKQITPLRLLGELVAKQAIISLTAPPPTA